MATAEALFELLKQRVEREGAKLVQKTGAKIRFVITPSEFPDSGGGGSPGAPAATSYPSQISAATGEIATAANGNPMAAATPVATATAANAKATWLVDLKSGKGHILACAGAPRAPSQAPEDKVDATVLVAEADFVAICCGRLTPHEAFMQQKMKVRGSVLLATRLIPLLATLGPRPSPPQRQQRSKL